MTKNKGKRIHYQVNGEPQTTDHKTLTVKEILENAGAAASIDVKELDKYILEDLESGKKYEGLHDPVEIKDGDKFVAIYAGRTPVA